MADDVVADAAQHGALKEAHAPRAHHDHGGVERLRLRHDAVAGPTQLEARLRVNLPRKKTKSVKTVTWTSFLGGPRPFLCGDLPEKSNWRQTAPGVIPMVCDAVLPLLTITAALCKNYHFGSQHNV